MFCIVASWRFWLEHWQFAMIAPVNNSPRGVVCYHCGSRIVSTVAARSTSCPSCNRRVMLDDIVIEVAGMWSGQIETCGCVVIRPTARLSTRLIAATESIGVSGVVTSRLACRGLVSIHHDATFKGDCEAAELTVEAGASIVGHFDICPG